MLDLDHFKDFNDSYGHPAGDRLLKETAVAWREELRAGDFLARLGGDEFALLLPHCTAADAPDVVDACASACAASRPARPGSPPTCPECRPRR